MHAGERKTEPHRSAANSQLPKDILLQWPGRLPRFSRLLEGGPGTPGTLAVMAILAAAMVWQGARMTERSEVEGAGPALLLLGAAWLLFLLFWVAIKAGLRDRPVIFYLTQRGAGIMPSARQRAIDRRLGCLMWLVFLITFKGGQWSAWHPFTPWKKVQRIETNALTRHIVISGGAWDVRLICTDNYDAVKTLVCDQIRAANTRCTVINVERA